MSNDEIKEMLYVSKNRSIFINEYTDESMKEKIMQFDFRELYGIFEGNIDILLEEFHEEGFTKYYRNL
jgi:hypothetical protein